MADLTVSMAGIVAQMADAQGLPTALIPRSSAKAEQTR